MSIQELNGTELPLNDVYLTFDEFCCIVAEFKNQHLESRRLWDVFTHSVQKVLGKLFIYTRIVINQLAYKIDKFCIGIVQMKYCPRKHLGDYGDATCV